jgi:cytochrome c-type biogenesis protein CcsB
MQTVETITYWAAVILYAGSFALFAITLWFKRRELLSKAILVCYGAFVLHTTALVARWIITGHPPFVSFFESVTAACWFGIGGYLILQRSKPELALSGLAVTAPIFMLMGWASMPSYAGEALGAGLRSAWLFVHASFATAAVGMFVVAAGISAIWLWKQKIGSDDSFDLPAPEIFDETVFRYIIVGFLFYTIMLLSGGIWANNAWGRYWGWDPIETWSLIGWLIYAVYLHIHFTFKKLRGAFTAWYAIIAVVAAAFSLWGVGYVYKTIHNYG